MPGGKAVLRQIAFACLVLLPLSFGGTSGWAAERRFTLAPGPVQVEFRAYGLGFMPIVGGFKRFSGMLTLDDADPTRCSLKLEGEAASLLLPSQAMTDDALGPDLLDVGQFPEFSMTARCDGPRMAATLTMHGVTKPVAMTVTRTEAAWSATGTIDRRAWGMGARPLLAGADVKLTIIAGVPAELPPRSR